MKYSLATCLARGERRAAPKPARIPSANWTRYAAGEGFQ